MGIQESAKKLAEDFRELEMTKTEFKVTIGKGKEVRQYRINIEERIPYMPRPFRAGNYSETE